LDLLTVSALGSTVGWTPARYNERTNEPTQIILRYPAILCKVPLQRIRDSVTLITN